MPPPDGSDKEATEVSPPRMESTHALSQAPAATVSARPAAVRRSLSSPATATGPLSLTTAADALRDEELRRTRLFILMGWGLSVFSLATLYFVDPPRVVAIAFVGGLVGGFFYSFVMYRRLADPANYTERALIGLSIVCALNGHLGVLLFGVYSAAPVLIVVGIHFMARTEMARVARWVFITCVVAYSTLSAVIIGGLIDDSGVFASRVHVPRETLVAATVFVLMMYALAYYTARTFRATALTSIDELQRATRTASQREALMEELRADLERALHVGGPGRYTDRDVGAFRLGSVLGRGAFGEVYEATHAQTGAVAAVKVLRREQLGDPTQVARFLREVELTRSVLSLHVVRVIDAAVPSGGLSYLAMEKLSGRTLGEQLRSQPRLTAAGMVELVGQVALGIDAVAALGIVHRDLKPQNLFRTDAGIWKILDFGVATLANTSGTLTQGEAVGTPHYMSPEQTQGRVVDTRTDLYALGAIVYRCLTGRYPLTAADTPALLYAIVHRMPQQPSVLMGTAGEDIDRWFAIALAKAPDDRFKSGDELASAFVAALAGELDGKYRKRADVLTRKSPWGMA